MKKTIKNLSLCFALALGIFSAPTSALADTPLYGSCVAAPTNAIVGDNVNWQVVGVTGGNGTYIYAWGGTDNLLGSNSNVYKTYTNPGTKMAYVTITSGGQVYTANCSTNVSASNGGYYNNGYYNNYPYNYGSTYNQPTQFTNNGYYYQGVFYPNNNGYHPSPNDGIYYNNGYNQNTSCGGYYQNGVYYNSCNNGYSYNNSYNNGTYYTNPTISAPSQTYVSTYSGNAGTPVAGVFLSQVPATGISAKSVKMILFTVGLLAWSFFAAYVISLKRKNRFAVAVPNNMSARIEEFKKRNMERKTSR